MTGLKRLGTIAASAAIALVVAIAGPAGAATAAGPNGNNGGKDIVSTTENYLTTFYPLWFTQLQTQFLPVPFNKLLGPETISWEYQAVVAINDDTLYASSPIDVSGGEVVVDVPASSKDLRYSVLLLDPWGNVYPSGVPSKTDAVAEDATTYSLVKPGYTGQTTGDIVVPLPLERMILIFRIDKYTDGEDKTGDATTFREKLSINGVGTEVRPVEFFSVPVKTYADELIDVDPVAFLRELQVAVADVGWRPPLSQQDQKLSDDFDALFGEGSSLTDAEREQFAEGARSAHDAIIANYLDTRGETNWTHFTNIGEWKKKVLDRASITEFCQYCNTSETAAYYHAFYDGDGDALTGANTDGYVLTFPADAIPDASRFWSLTAYTPEAIQPIRAAAPKYLVASYTEGLVTNTDGSISIYIGGTPPTGLEANWLPVGDEQFNIMLRIYGVVPKSDIAKDKYVPPAIEKR